MRSGRSIIFIVSISAVFSWIDSIVGWYFNDDGQATPPAGNNFLAISGGGFYSPAIIEPSARIIFVPDRSCIGGSLRPSQNMVKLRKFNDC